MDFGKAFTFMFEDPDWLRKLGIGTLIGLVGVLLFWTIIVPIVVSILVLGYTLEVTRNLLVRREPVLPEWHDWSGFLSRGFKLFIAFLIWSLPIIVAMIPMMIGAALTDNNSGAEGLGIFMILCTSCLMMLWLVVVFLFTPAIYVAVAHSDSFAAAFNFARLWAFTRDNLGNVIVSIILAMVLVPLIAAVVGSLGFIVLLIGALITIPAATLWQYLVQAHLFGQIGATSVTSIE
jgi:hypothetical protein